MRKELLATILILTIGGWQVHEASAQTRLVVSLTIDQLRSDYIDAYSPYYGSQGFKRLLREGKIYKRVEYSFNVKEQCPFGLVIQPFLLPRLRERLTRKYGQQYYRKYIG